MRLGILGGTFNPIHFGHLNSAGEIAHIFGLEKIIFIPANIPPHKEPGDQNPYYRLEMTRLAVQGNPLFITSPVEIERGGVSFTIDTLNELKLTYGAEDEFFLILGFDAFLEIDKWKDSQMIFNQCNIIVNIRQSINSDKIDLVLSHYKDITFGSKEKNEQSGYEKVPVTNTPFAVYAVSTTFLDISATEIREKVKKGEPIKYLLPKNVEEFILKNKIYTNA